MSIYELDPLKDPRWGELVNSHPMATAFHSTSWLEALYRSYGYEPVALTTTEPGCALKNGLVFCRMKSWLTGSRMVSLPFSDHCQPLVDAPDDWIEMLRFVRTSRQAARWKYLELRPGLELDPCVLSATGLKESASFCFHELDLRPSLDDIFRSFHKTSVRQMLRRAEREEIAIQTGRSEALLKTFYGLLLLTRRRHQLPPQPFAWFRNLAERFQDKLTIRLAFKDSQPIASVLTLSHQKKVIYKYGCSDARFHSLGSMPILFWDAIQEAKKEGAEQFDFGRSDLDNPGLIAFKDHWGGARTRLTYYRYAPHAKAKGPQDWKISAARKTFSYLPDFCLTTAGRLLYKHIG